MPAGKWLCTLSGRKAVAIGATLTVRFWERADDEADFHVEVNGGEDLKEGRLLREVLRLRSEGARRKGAHVAMEAPVSNRSDGRTTTESSVS